jgi:hypothetical protein
MLASIWLRLAGEQCAVVQSLIKSLAEQHATPPFEAHLTVCGGTDLDPASWDAAADYVRQNGHLPITVRKTRVSFSTTVWSRAVVIDVEDDPVIRAFREALSRIAGGAIQAPPHISLLYPMGADARLLSWAGDETRLGAIAEDCEARLTASEFDLGDPVVVAPERDWANISSWKVVRSL